MNPEANTKTDAKRELTPEEIAAKRQLNWLTATKLIAVLQREVMRVEDAAGAIFPTDTLLLAMTAQIVLLRAPAEKVSEAMAFVTKQLQPALDGAAKLEEQLSVLPPELLEQLANVTKRFNPNTLGTEACTCGAPACPGTIARAKAAAAQKPSV